MRNILLISFYLLPFFIRAQENPFVPKSYEVQYAGNIGMISASPIWEINKVLTIQLGVGYTPKFEAEKTIWSINTKFFYTPKVSFNIKKINLKPLIIGAGINYTFGNKYNKYYNINQYPSGYYWWGTAIRYGLIYRIETSTNSKKNKISFYFEISAWDLDIYNYANRNYQYLKLTEVLTFGIGGRIYLN